MTLFDDWAADDALQATLKPHDPRHRSMCSIDADGRNVDVFWGGHEYSIDLDRITSKDDLLGWVAHLGAKSWPNMTPYRLVLFVRLVCQAKGWEPPHV